jgi:hypothetical protein
VNIWQIRCAAYWNLLRHPLDFTYSEDDGRDTLFCAFRPIYVWEPKNCASVTGNARLAARVVILLGRSEDGSALIWYGCYYSDIEGSHPSNVILPSF